MPSWSKSKGRGERYVRVSAHSVVVGEHDGSGRSDMAGSCSHEDFLAGRYHDVILSGHGPSVLAEVLAAVRSAADDVEFAPQRSREARLIAAWQAIPEDRSLCAMAASPDERGSDHRGGSGLGGVWHLGLFYAPFREGIRVTRSNDALVFEVPAGRNDLGIGHDIRAVDVVRVGDAVIFRCENYFLQDAPRVMSLLGRTTWLQVDAAGLRARCRDGSDGSG